MNKSNESFVCAEDCRNWLEEKGIAAEISDDYIFISYENSTHWAIKDGNIPFEFINELQNKLNCKLGTISIMTPDPNDDNPLWYCRRKIVNQNGFLINLACRKFGDGGSEPIHTNHWKKNQ